VSSRLDDRLPGVDPDAARSLFVVIERPAALDAVDALCERVHAAITRSGARSLVCDVSALTDPDELALETTARLQLTAKRASASMRLVGVAPRLADLLGAAGFDEVVPEWRSGLEVHGHAEELEQFGIDEEVDAGDLGV
jgi:anti-anti-sigma regulatory factor